MSKLSIALASKLVLPILIAACVVPCSLAGPLKVFILAGQSNMQGHAQVRTMEHLRMDDQTVPLLQEMVDKDGTPKTCEQVWISSIGHDGTETERHGPLSADYGAAGGGPKIGPEFTFGIYAQKLLNEPVLIIKTAWGGKSLHTDFRPPSAGPFEFNKTQLDTYKNQGKDLEQIQRDKREATGRYYHLMIKHVQKVLSDITRVYPNYEASQGHELAGFVWFQGWNDMVDRGVYPHRDQPGGYDQYSEVLSHFIRDVRRDLSAPTLPFVIGVMGAGGPIDMYGPEQKRYASIHRNFRQAMAAPAKLPEFKNSVRAVWTENYWDNQLGELANRWQQINAKNRSLRNDQSLTPESREQALEAYKHQLFTDKELRILETGKSNAEYHYLGSAKILAQIGKAFAEAAVELQP